MPNPFDIRWLIPHSAFLYANDEGKGLQFCNALYHARFSRGENIAGNDVLIRAASGCDLDGDAVIRAGRNRDYHERVLSGMSKLEEVNIFGVPTFLFDNNLYWGNDRLDWLIRSIFEKQGKQVPDLVKEPLNRPF